MMVAHTRPHASCSLLKPPGRSLACRQQPRHEPAPVHISPYHLADKLDLP